MPDRTSCCIIFSLHTCYNKWWPVERDRGLCFWHDPCAFPASFTWRYGPNTHTLKAIALLLSINMYQILEQHNASSFMPLSSNYSSWTALCWRRRHCTSLECQQTIHWFEWPNISEGLNLHKQLCQILQNNVADTLFQLLQYGSQLIIPGKKVTSHRDWRFYKTFYDICSLHTY